MNAWFLAMIFMANEADILVAIRVSDNRRLCAWWVVS